MPVSTMFLRQSLDFLLNAYLPRIEHCVAELKEEDLWWRPNEASNSIGNLVLHLSGNLRQWIVSGVGGKPDTRARQTEFDAREGKPGSELLKGLRSVVEEAAEVLAEIDPRLLSEKRTIQQKDVSVFYAVYHAVEHFSMHTGQIIQMTKERTGKDLKFYGFEKGVPVERWRANRD